MKNIWYFKYLTLCGIAIDNYEYFKLKLLGECILKLNSFNFQCTSIIKAVFLFY